MKHVCKVRGLKGRRDSQANPATGLARFVIEIAGHEFCMAVYARQVPLNRKHANLDYFLELAKLR